MNDKKIKEALKLFKTAEPAPIIGEYERETASYTIEL
jgi:hypothetical protein